MKTVYLSNGQEAELIKVIDDNSFLVQPIFKVANDFEEFYEIPGKQEVVDAVYDSPPIAKIQEEYDAINKELSSAEEQLQQTLSELRQAKHDLEVVQKQKTDVGKMIYNRSELKTAKRITLFPKDDIVPIDANEKMRKYLKLSIELKIFSGEENMWAHIKAYDEGSYDSGKYIDPKCGLICDASDEEIMRIAKERAASRNDWSDWVLKRTPDEYLNDALIEMKRASLEKNRQHQISSLKAEIEKAQASLKKLEENK